MAAAAAGISKLHSYISEPAAAGIDSSIPTKTRGYRLLVLLPGQQTLDSGVALIQRNLVPHGRRRRSVSDE